MSDKDHRHHFEITIRTRSAGADWDMPLETQDIRAYSLAEALQAALDLPFADWFSDEDKGITKATDEKAQREP